MKHLFFLIFILLINGAYENVIHASSKDTIPKNEDFRRFAYISVTPINMFRQGYSLNIEMVGEKLAYGLSAGYIRPRCKLAENLDLHGSTPQSLRAIFPHLDVLNMKLHSRGLVARAMIKGRLPIIRLKLLSSIQIAFSTGIMALPSILLFRGD